MPQWWSREAADTNQRTSAFIFKDCKFLHEFPFQFFIAHFLLYSHCPLIILIQSTFSVFSLFIFIFSFFSSLFFHCSSLLSVLSAMTWSITQKGFERDTSMCFKSIPQAFLLQVCCGHEQVLQHSVLRSVPVGLPASLHAGISSHSGKVLHNVTVIVKYCS